MRTVTDRWVVALAVILLASCDGDRTAGPSAAVSTVAVIPTEFSLVVGDSLRLTTLSRDRIGTPLSGRAASWATSHPSVVKVDATGIVTGVGVGSATVTASIEGKTGTALVTVSPNFPVAAFVSVAAGGAHTCALTAAGSAHCWGRGESGQLGVPPPVMTCLSDLSYPCSLVPIPVDGGHVFAQLTAGGAHTCGLTSDGSAWCWGNNAFGQLGDNSQASRSAPVSVATTLKFASIDAGPDQTCGLTSEGIAWCWGRNTSGQLGDSTTTNRPVPVAVRMPAGLSIHAIRAGGSDRGFACALTGTGEPYCWGYNGSGQLGRGFPGNLPQPVPAPVSGELRFASLTAGLGDHTCGLTATGAAWCWGANSRGSLGDGTTRFSSPLPVAVSGGLVFAQLVTGGWGGAGHTCGLTSSGVAYCWGDNEVGAVGDGSSTDRPTPTPSAGGHTFASIEAGFRHSCARTQSGTLYCWGSGRTGQLGANTVNSSALPMKVIGQP